MIEVRRHGRAGPALVVIHGGPAAPGSVAPVARELADDYRVLEPWQRRSGGAPLSVARHVQDLSELIEAECHGERPTLVGHSWGAMLALATAAAHPERTGSLVLVGCGTFDPVARERFRKTVDARTGEALARRLAALSAEHPDPDERLRAFGEALLPAYSRDLASSDLELGPCDAAGHRETWDDWVRLEREGVYPAAFAAIGAPVLMLHGDADPHPGPLIRASLEPVLRRFEFAELPRCGHYPWLERQARGAFFRLLRAWLAVHA